MKLVLDTNAYCLCDVGHNQALDLLEEADSLHMPVIVYGELYYGFKFGKRFEQNLKRLDQFLHQFDVSLIEVNLDVARKFGDIYAHLRKIGRPVPTNDLWIAACTMSIGGVLLTADKHFQSVPQIQKEIIQPSVG